MSILTMYRKDVLSSNNRSIIKALHDKPFHQWEMERDERLAKAALLMIEMGIKKRTYEFHDADLKSTSKNEDNRIRTFSDYLVKHGIDATIVSRQLENGYYGDVKVIKNDDYYGGLSFYPTIKDIKAPKIQEERKSNENLSYRYMDSLIFDNFHKYLEYYVRTALAFNKDCFIPIIGYKNSYASAIEIEKQEQLKQKILSVEKVSIQQAEIKDENNGFIKVLKISKK